MNKTFKAVVNWLHLWLGLASGIVVFIVSITGCIYVFQAEIMNSLEPWRFVEAQNQQYVPPSVLVDTASVHMPGKTPSGLTYEDETGAAAVGFYYTREDQLDFAVVFMNPYTGEFLHKNESILDGDFDFFEFIIEGHRYLWLPQSIGKMVVGIGTLIFIVLLITGLVLWWPKKWNASGRQKSFKIRWSAKWKRFNYDLHNVPGFYALILSLILAVTGLVWSFEWFNNGLYYLASGGDSKQEHVHPHSNPDNAGLAETDSIPAIDQAFYKTLELYPDPKRIYMSPTLQEADDAIEIVMYKYKGKFYHHDEYYYDQHTLELLDVERFSEAGLADQMDHLYYDIHTGIVWGLPGKILAFIVSLVCASLPVTGFFVWYNKRKRKG
ncbi:PepSY-associated TM helix domain-containing protein [Rhodohalobacter sp. 614A]|uniref:PepSY-associated TM helix domain-containing protein n=1 Tax=Rhodohalobacter sp. 614A TaxID=2908649 RepID=UPI001F3314A6|nr:PepSY-associated TM helix domain-containing protein [Rhodohalobacter sp. 614A]